ncbi:hypothetical protein BHE74_00013159 [Ensete ventricosum]|nr:hypothetical protein BHE74_00013159 [Ensete ventricosum]
MITSDMDPNIAPPIANIRRTKKPLNPGRDSQAFGSNGAPRSPPLRYNAAPASLLGCHLHNHHSSRCLHTVAPSPLLRRPITADLLCHFFLSQPLLISDLPQSTLPFARVEVEEALPEAHQDGREIKTSVKQDAKPGLNQEGESSSRGEAQVTLKPLSGNS